MSSNSDDEPRVSSFKRRGFWIALAIGLVAGTLVRLGWKAWVHGPSAEFLQFFVGFGVVMFWITGANPEEDVSLGQRLWAAVISGGIFASLMWLVDDFGW